MNDTNQTVSQALNWLKSLVNWPSAGVQDFSGFWAYLKGNWPRLLFIFIALFVIMWLIKKIINWVINMFNG